MRLCGANSRCLATVAQSFLNSDFNMYLTQVMSKFVTLRLLAKGLRRHKHWILLDLRLRGFKIWGTLR